MKCVFVIFLVVLNKGSFAQMDSLNYHLDSLKWKYYTLTFDVELKKLADEKSQYRVVEDSIFNAVECEIKLDTIEYGGDTIKYYLDFYRNNPSDKYVQKKADSFVGVAFVKHKNIYFPLLGETYLSAPLEHYKFLFDKREDMFVEFIINYNGNMSSSLKRELIQRKLLK